MQNEANGKATGRVGTSCDRTKCCRADDLGKGKEKEKKKPRGNRSNNAKVKRIWGKMKSTEHREVGERKKKRWRGDNDLEYRRGKSRNGPKKGERPSGVKKRRKFTQIPDGGRERGKFSNWQAKKLTKKEDQSLINFLGEERGKRKRYRGGGPKAWKRKGKKS